jgi:hypothetical protein
MREPSPAVKSRPTAVAIVSARNTEPAEPTDDGSPCLAHVSPVVDV